MLAEVPQLLVNGLVAGTILAVPAIGFTAIYAVLRFPNFTVASHATIGAFAGYVVNVALGSIPGAVVGALTIGVAEELSLLSLAPAYRTAVGFVAILLVLTLRPRGLLGERAY